jgi:murein DD-endopeptidase MepM/ murein hydrolase activator NlpD
MVATSVLAMLGVLCCGGIVTAMFLSDDGGEGNLVSASFDCTGQFLPEGADLPAFADYGPQQIGHALTIVRVGEDMGVPVRGWVIAVATALTESRLRNYANNNPKYPRVRQLSLALPHDAVGTDHDSVGLFQQRPIEGAGGWGTVKELMTPAISAEKFYSALLRVRGWEQMPLTRAAQRVQKSGYPEAYRDEEPLATQIVNTLTGGSALVAIGDGLGAGCAGPGEIASSGWTVPVDAPVGSGFRTRSRPSHQGVDLSLGKGKPIYAVAAGVVSVVKCDETRSGRRDCNVDGYPGKGGCGWMVEIVHADRVMTRYCHLVRRPAVRVGQQVAVRDLIGLVGSSGNSSGPHLHFEIHVNTAGRADRTNAVDPVTYMRSKGVPMA